MQATLGTQEAQDKVHKTRAINLDRQIHKHQQMSLFSCFPNNEYDFVSLLILYFLSGKKINLEIWVNLNLKIEPK
jgi:hypothetical protein